MPFTMKNRILISGLSVLAMSAILGIWGSAWGVYKGKRGSNGHSGNGAAFIDYKKATKIFSDLNVALHDNKIIIGTFLANPDKRGLINKDTGEVTFEVRDKKSGKWPSEISVIPDYRNVTAAEGKKGSPTNEGQNTLIGITSPNERTHIDKETGKVVNHEQRDSDGNWHTSKQR